MFKANSMFHRPEPRKSRLLYVSAINFTPIGWIYVKTQPPNLQIVIAPVLLPLMLASIILHNWRGLKYLTHDPPIIY